MGTLATRDHFGNALLELAPQFPNFLIVNCDLAIATRTTEFKEKYSNRFIECGISEANAISISAGLSQEGFRPLVCSFGHFLTGKFLEIFQSVGLNGAGVVLVGTHAGLAIGKDGPTQMGLRDVGLMRLLPNLQIIHPTDRKETVEALRYALTTREPLYIRLCRQPGPEFHDDSYQFYFGAPDVLSKGTDLVILSQGGTLIPAWHACCELKGEGIEVGLVNLSSLPFQMSQFVEVVKNYSKILVVEDHFVKGGIADEVAYALCTAQLSKKVKFVGVPDYAQAGPSDALYERYGLDALGIKSVCLSMLKGK